MNMVMNIISGTDNTEVIAEFTKRVGYGTQSEMEVNVDGVSGTAVFNTPVKGMMYIFCGVVPKEVQSKYEPDKVTYFRPMTGLYAVHPVSVFQEMFLNVKGYKVA